MNVLQYKQPTNHFFYVELSNVIVNLNLNYAAIINKYVVVCRCIIIIIVIILYVYNKKKKKKITDKLNK